VIGKSPVKQDPMNTFFIRRTGITSVSVAPTTPAIRSTTVPKTTQAELPDCLSWPGYSSLANNPTEPFCFSRNRRRQGLKGSAYYAKNPIYPDDKTVANINIDGLGSYGKMKDIVVIGNGQSQLEDYLSEEAKKADRYVAKEPNPAAGYYFRSDHFNFAKVGIPALFTATASTMPLKAGLRPTTTGRVPPKALSPASDEYDSATWNSEGASQIYVLYLVGKRLAFGTEWPH